MDGDELEPEFSGLCVKPCRFLVLPAPLSKRDVSEPGCIGLDWLKAGPTLSAGAP